MKHLSWKYRRKRTALEQKEFCREQSKRVNRRWEKVHADGEVRSWRKIGSLKLDGPWVDGTTASLEVWDDGAQRKRVVIENGKPWGKRVSRKSLVKWFDAFLKARGV